MEKIGLLKKIVISIFFALTFITSCANALLTGGAPVTLSEGEKSQLEYMVCKSNYNLNANKINAFTFRDTKTTESNNNSRTLARVECESHGQVNNKPMRYIDECDFSEKKWTCPEPQLEIIVTINGRDVKMRPWKLTPEAATGLLNSINARGYFQGESLDKAIGSSCDVSKTKDPEIMELACDAVIRISFWCPQNQITGCPRILFVSREELP
jgi:hypothetical protein